MILSPSLLLCRRRRGWRRAFTVLAGEPQEGVGKSTLLLTTLLARQVFTQVAVSLPDPSTLTQAHALKSNLFLPPVPHTIIAVAFFLKKVGKGGIILIPPSSSQNTGGKLIHINGFAHIFTRETIIKRRQRQRDRNKRQIKTRHLLYAEEKHGNKNAPGGAAV